MFLWLFMILVQTSVGKALRVWLNLVRELVMQHTLNLLSSCLNQVSESCGQKLWILNAMWETLFSFLSYLVAIFTV
jgi:hypothetical protein